MTGVEDQHETVKVGDTDLRVIHSPSASPFLFSFSFILLSDLYDVYHPPTTLARPSGFVPSHCSSPLFCFSRRRAC